MTDSDEAEEQQPEEFLNRAARRAKGKKGAKTSEVGAGQSAAAPHGRGAVASRRQQYGNRRTG